MPKGRRLERLTARLKQELGAIISFQLKDPRVGFATVTRIKLSPDLTQVQVFVSVLGPEPQERGAMRALNHARGHIQSLIAERVDMRRHPEITFHLDRGLKHSLRVAEILTELREERGPEASDGVDAPQDSSNGEETGEAEDFDEDFDEDLDEDLDEAEDPDAQSSSPSRANARHDGRPPPSL